MEIKSNHALMQMQAMRRQAEAQPIEFIDIPFDEVMQNTVGQANTQQQTASNMQNQYEMGDPSVSIGEVMIETQKANLAFQGILTARNKLVAAYQEVMNMPV